MKHAITTVKVQLDTLLINEAVARKEGDTEKAQRHQCEIAEHRIALALLNGVAKLLDFSQLNLEP